MPGEQADMKGREGIEPNRLWCAVMQNWEPFRLVLLPAFHKSPRIASR